MKRTDAMKRASFFKHGSEMILKFDLSGLKSTEEVESVVKYFASVVGNMPKRSIVGLVDFSNLVVEDSMAKDMIRLTELSSPHFRATAVIAPSVATKALASAVIDHFGRVNMKIFNSNDQGIEWLVAQ